MQAKVERLGDEFTALLGLATEWAGRSPESQSAKEVVALMAGAHCTVQRIAELNAESAADARIRRVRTARQAVLDAYLAESVGSRLHLAEALTAVDRAMEDLARAGDLSASDSQ